MKLYFQDLNIRKKNIEPLQQTIEEYHTFEGLYLLKNNKVLKYSLQQSEDDKIVSKIVNNLDCYVSYDFYNYEGIYFHIPKEHLKIIINRSIYKITDKLSYIEDKTTHLNKTIKTENYFISDNLLTDPNLKKILSTLII